MVSQHLSTLATDLDNQLADAQKTMTALETKRDLLAVLTREIDEEKRVYGVEQYDLGVRDAQEAAGNQNGKIYSLDEANALIDEATAPLKSQISQFTADQEAMSTQLADLQAQVTGLQGQVDLHEQAVKDAVKAREMEIAERIRDAQVDDIQLAEELSPKAQM